MSGPNVDRRSLIGCVLSVATGAFSGCARAVGDGDVAAHSPVGPWPMLARDAANTGHAAGIAPVRESPAVGWEQDVGGAVSGPPVVGPERLFVGTRTGQFHAIDRRSGERAFTRSNFGGPFSRYPVAAAAAVGEDHVYVTSGGGRFRALDRETGMTAWRVTELGSDGSIVYSSPALVDGHVVVGAGDGTVTAVRAGEVDWSSHVDGPVPFAPAVGASGVVAVGEPAVALDADTGEENWSRRPGDVVAAPVQGQGLLYLHTQGQGVVALDSREGSVEWRYDEGAPTDSRPAVADGTLYVGRGSAVHAVDAATGDRRWHRRATARVRGSPSVVDDTVYVGTEAGAVLALDAATGTERWRFETDSAIRAAVAAADGTVYAGSQSGTVYALARRATET